MPWISHKQRWEIYVVCFGSAVFPDITNGVGRGSKTLCVYCQRVGSWYNGNSNYRRGETR